MSNYSVIAGWGSKDALPTGNATKLVSATELGLEFAAIATMSATKEDAINKSAANGYAALDAGSKLLVTNLPIFGSAVAGAVPASGGGTSTFLRADGTWTAPSAGTAFTSHAGAYTLVIGDANTIHSQTAAANFTVPSNASVAFALGTLVTLVNATGSAISITINTDTLQLAGTVTTGTRTLAAGGAATLVKIATTTWLVSGAGVT